VGKKPFPTISLEEFQEKHLPNIDEEKLQKVFEEDLLQEVRDGKITEEKRFYILNKVRP